MASHLRTNKSHTYQADNNRQKMMNLQMNESKNRINNSTHQYANLNQTPSIKKFIHNIKQVKNEVNGHNQSRSNSNASHRIPNNSFLYSDKVIELQEKLKNIHIFYKTKIQAEKSKLHQRNQVFLHMSQELLRSHNDKIANLKTLYNQAEVQKKDVGLVDQRMNEIKASIDEILKQSSDLKQSNQNLTMQIQQRQYRMKQKEEELNKVKKQLLENRNELQAFERTNLKENKRNKDIMGLIQKIGSSK